MTKRRIPISRLIPAALAIAAPGGLVLVALAAAGLLGTGWTVAGILGCIVLAFVVAHPIVGDLGAVSDYADRLAREGAAAAETPVLTGWAPVVELAARVRRIARRAEATERELRDGMVSSQMVFDSLPQPLLLLDDGRRVLRVNRACRRLTGGNPAGGDLAAAFRDPGVLEAADAVLADKTAREVSLTVPDPVERFFTVQIVPLSRPAADGATVLVALYDLTERRRAEQMRADFIANASHELRTPLATLTGFIETLQGAARDDAAARERFLGLMREQAARMGRLVEDLLSLSEIELTEHTPPSETADAVRVLERVIESLRLEAANKDMTLALEAGPGLPAVSGDADQLAQLFQNLIDNAIKYGRAGTEIRVSVAFRREVPGAMAGDGREAPPPGVVRIAVADEGEGIAPEHIPRLTERFYRVDTARSRAVGGTGLGLAIVKHIVGRHRGLLEIESEEGRGSTFTVFLPAAAAAGAAAPDRGWAAG